jgi:hypothetical protein
VGLLLLLCITNYFITILLLKYNTIFSKENMPLLLLVWPPLLVLELVLLLSALPALLSLLELLLLPLSCLLSCLLSPLPSLCSSWRCCYSTAAAATAIIMSVVTITIMVLKLEMGEVQLLQLLLLPLLASSPSSYRGWVYL